MLNGHLAHEEHSQGRVVGQTHGAHASHVSHGSSALDEKVQGHHVEHV